MSKRLTSAEFITKACAVHGGAYDYSNVVYVNNRSKVNITCKVHGSFSQTANDHLQGYGCPTCGGTKQHTTRSFVTTANEIHACKYSYDLTQYRNLETKVIIVCPLHGEFKQTPRAHVIDKRGCPDCAKVGFLERNNRSRLSSDSFRVKSIQVHGSRYDYTTTQYVDAHTPVSIRCSKHGEFTQTPANHVWNKNGCPSCAKEREQEKLTYSHAWFDHNPDKKNLPGILYLLRFTSETEQFIKVGVTLNNSKRRFYSHHKGYTITPILERQLSIHESYTIEQKILAELSTHTYVPRVRFGGMTECFVDSKAVVSMIKEYMYGTIQ